jgi:hypothetical protein
VSHCLKENVTERSSLPQLECYPQTRMLPSVAEARADVAPTSRQAAYRRGQRPAAIHRFGSLTSSCR